MLILFPTWPEVGPFERTHNEVRSRSRGNDTLSRIICCIVVLVRFTHFGCRISDGTDVVASQCSARGNSNRGRPRTRAPGSQTRDGPLSEIDIRGSNFCIGREVELHIGGSTGARGSLVLHRARDADALSDLSGSRPFERTHDEVRSWSRVLAAPWFFTVLVMLMLFPTCPDVGPLRELTMRSGLGAEETTH